MHFSKNDTLVTKGVAILFLICYHCFSTTDRLAGYDVSFYPLSQKTAMWIAESMNICVAMFAFLSVYGYTIIVKQKYNHSISAIDYAKFSTTRYIQLIGTFFLPFLICEIVCFFMHIFPYGTGKVEFIFNALFDLLGLSMFFHTPLLCGTWWYLGITVLFIVSFPILHILYKKIDFLIIPFIAILMLLTCDEINNLSRFFFSAPLAIVFADKDIFYHLKQYKREHFLFSLGKRILCIFLLIALLYIRKHPWAYAHIHLLINCLIAPLMIFIIYDILKPNKLLARIFMFLGKHSGNIFFVHTFIRWFWLRDFTYSLGHSVIIFLFVLLTSLLLSFFIQFLNTVLAIPSKIQHLCTIINRL